MKDLLLSHFQYTFWADGKLFECIAELSEEQLKADHPYSQGSVWAQCLHMYMVEYWWFLFLRIGEMPTSWEAGEETLDWLRTQWAANRDTVLAYLESVTDADLKREVKPPHWDEDEAPVIAWQAILQVANHSTDHRSQVLRILAALDVTTFEQDYLNYLDTIS